ncbi:hypothetical protein ACFC26_12495 [Kitasatospora purpeofusca]|uniref:hypothetical protein n=1 Tax=Kitasatospora purpeofusca TaxID=67352 RepID=UPI0035DED233
MAKTTTAAEAPTFASLAGRHGRALASIAGHDNNPLPADPTTVDDAGLVELVTGAAAFLTACRRFEDAETLESAAGYLADARTADAADRPTLLRQAQKHLATTYDIASELACDLGEERDF